MANLNAQYLPDKGHAFVTFGGPDARQQAEEGKRAVLANFLENGLKLKVSFLLYSIPSQTQPINRSDGGVAGHQKSCLIGILARSLCQKTKHTNSTTIIILRTSTCLACNPL
jgi:hypothetical protein